MITQENITVVQRLKSPKPKLFRILGTVGGLLVAVGTSLLAAPITIPVLTAVAGYMIAVGGAVGSVAILPVDFRKLKELQQRKQRTDAEATAEETRWANEGEARSKL